MQYQSSSLEIIPDLYLIDREFSPGLVAADAVWT
jgi:hypothetical protein